jgi:PhnB protein
MLKTNSMVLPGKDRVSSGIFITFTGNCKRALTFYQTCFGGELYFETFPSYLPGYTYKPIISGSLISGRISIHGSDLPHEEGRTVGNYLSVFLRCKSPDDRARLLRKLNSFDTSSSLHFDEEQKLIELRDTFDVTWILGI